MPLRTRKVIICILVVVAAFLLVDTAPAQAHKRGHAHWAIPAGTPRVLTVKNTATSQWNKPTRRAIVLWNKALHEAKIPLSFALSTDTSSELSHAWQSLQGSRIPLNSLSLNNVDVLMLTMNDFPQNSGTQLDFPTSSYEIQESYIIFNDFFFKESTKGWNSKRKQLYLNVSACETFGWALGLPSRSQYARSCMNSQRIKYDAPGPKDVVLLNHMYRHNLPK